MAKTELVLFSRARQRSLNQHLREATVMIGGERIKFNKEAVRLENNCEHSCPEPDSSVGPSY